MNTLFSHTGGFLELMMCYRSMLEDQSIQHLISWSNSNESFVMSPTSEFSKVLAYVSILKSMIPSFQSSLMNDAVNTSNIPIYPLLCGN
jgi:hypothetical protein